MSNACLTHIVKSTCVNNKAQTRVCLGGDGTTGVHSPRLVGVRRIRTAAGDTHALPCEHIGATLCWRWRRQRRRSRWWRRPHVALCLHMIGWECWSVHRSS